MITATTAPVYTTYQAVYLEEVDPNDGNSYLYVAFSTDTTVPSITSVINVMKILNEATVSIEWYY
jgi:hypothetical protein